MPDLSPLALKRAYVRLFDEYGAFTGETCPAKLSLDVSRPGPGLGVFGNAMAARLSDGHFGGKFITVNEDNGGEMAALIAVFAPSGHLLRTLDGVHLTRLRCGMMAVQAAHRFFGAHALPGLRYGFVGSGKINAQTARVLSEVFAVPGTALFLLGSRRNPSKNLNLYPGGARVVSAPGDLASCDVIFECSNVSQPEEVLEVSDFTVGAALPPLFVTQNSGWMLGPTFRWMMPSFTDHVEQMNAHRGSDYDWPWDGNPHVLIEHDLRHSGYSRTVLDRAAVYLTGMALADLVGALEADLP
ncbi:MAG: hypothetical protein KGQ93_14040 [Cyanobacteria bacterium REEB459]|nr:hypothetical protein [Cyanobacteria bacterium REEB459]